MVDWGGANSEYDLSIMRFRCADATRTLKPWVRTINSGIAPIQGFIPQSSNAQIDFKYLKTMLKAIL